MAEDELKFGVSLEDQMSGPSKAASKSLADLTSSMLSTKKELASYQSQLALSKNVGDIAGYKKYTALVSEHRSKLFALNETIASTPKDVAPAAGAFEGIAAALGPIGEGALIAGGALLAFGGILGGLIVKGALFAIEANQAKQAMLGMFDAMAGAGAGLKLDDMLSGLSDEIGISKDKLAVFTQSFLQMGVTGEEALHTLTLAAISANAIVGSPKGAEAFEKLTKRIQLAGEAGTGLKLPIKGLGSLYEMGIRVDDVAKKMGLSSAALTEQLKKGTANAGKFGDALSDALIEKGAGPLARLGNSFAEIKGKFISNVTDMFEDIDVGPFMAQVRDFFSIFQMSKPSGEAMKAGIGGGLKYVFQVATSTILPIKHFFQDVELAALDAAIFIAEHWGDIAPILNGVADSASFVAQVVRGNWSEIAPVLRDVGIAALVVAGAFVLVAGIVAGAVVAFVAIITEIHHLEDSLMGLAVDAVKLGGDFVAGFAEGILSTIPIVGPAGVAMADAAWKGAKNFLKSSSPSKLTQGLGGDTGTGMAIGITNSIPEVRSASRDMGMAAYGGATQGLRASDYGPAAFATQSGSQGAQGKITIEVGGITIIAKDGVTDAQSLTETAVAMLFERLQLQQGT